MKSMSKTQVVVLQISAPYCLGLCLSHKMVWSQKGNPQGKSSTAGSHGKGAYQVFWQGVRELERTFAQITFHQVQTT